jgi:hypothetical protein
VLPGPYLWEQRSTALIYWSCILIFLVLAVSKALEVFTTNAGDPDPVTGLSFSALRLLVAGYGLLIAIVLLSGIRLQYKGAVILTFCMQVGIYKILSAAWTSGSACPCLGALSSGALPLSNLTISIITWILLAYLVTSGCILFLADRREQHFIRTHTSPV